MGSRNFYKGPEGKFVAWMLEKSGIVWGRYTVQYRFLFMHYYTKYAQTYQENIWFGNKLLDIATALFVPYMEPPQRESYFNKSFGALTDALDIDNPYASLKNSIPKATDEDREKYLRALGTDGFSSIGDLITAMTSVNERVNK